MSANDDISEETDLEPLQDNNGETKTKDFFAVFLKNDTLNFSQNGNWNKL